MRIAVTVESATDSEHLLVECDDSATVEEFEQSLHRHLGRPVRVPGRAQSRLAATVAHGSLLGSPRPLRALGAAKWQVHVVSGPDAGVIWGLPYGDHILGRSGGIWWNDRSMSRRHLALQVTADEVQVRDLGSRHGSRIDGQDCPQDHQIDWRAGSTLEVGRSVAILRERTGTDAVWEEASPGWRRLLRPPRLSMPTDPVVVAFPQAPKPPEKRRLPMVAIAAPLVVGVAMAAVMRRPEYLMFALASPLMVVAGHVAQRWGSSRKHAAAVASHAVEVTEVEGRLLEAIEAEQQVLRDEQPDAAATLLTAALPGRRLWERRRDDSDFLRLRLGVADLPSGVVVEGDATREATARLVPRSVDLASVSVLGLVGPSEMTDAVLRWWVAQLATHHAPRDLTLVFVGLGLQDRWPWLPWLPHLNTSVLGGRSRAPATDPRTIADRIAEVKALIRRREHLLASDRTAGLMALPAVVVVVRGYREVSQVSSLRTIVERGTSVGVHVLCSGAVDSELPESARAVVSVDGDGVGASLVSAVDTSTDALLLDQVSDEWADALARALAPFKGVTSEDDATVPDTVHLLELLQPAVGDVEEIRARWRSRPRTMRAVIGIGPEGRLAVDLSADGPHALVAGMTGSGKTELLQTLVASLALANHPHSLNFVLIDYKGDSAFRECARLPHTVGKVNDLNPAEVERALISLRAELARRKAVLATAGATDIDDYFDLASGNPDQAPLPRLVLVIDEFAELARDLPEFVDGLVSIAQQGRSLGVHLVLATQRPHGVISPAVRANTNIRIALRVADAADSTDVIGVAEAAHIPASRPGRGCMRVGAHAVVKFQTARVACRSLSRERAPTRGTVLKPLRWHDLGEAWSEAGMEPDDGAGVSDLSTIAERLAEAAQVEGLTPLPQPWLDPLPETLMRSRADAPGAIASFTVLPFGRSDHPDEQRQRTVCFDLERDGHLFFVGAPRSGRSQALLVLAAAIAERADPGDLHLYAIDCGAGALDVLSALPHCGAVVTRQEGERLGRLLARLAAELEARLARGPSDESPRIVLMVDQWEGFAATVGDLSDGLDIILRLLREGASVGIHLVITGDRTLVINARLSAMTDCRYVLRMGDKADYVLAGLNPKVVGAMPPGRCYGPGGVETQVFVLDSDSSRSVQAEAVRRAAARSAPVASVPAHRRPFRIDALPKRPDTAQAIALLPTSASKPAPIVGIGGDELKAFAPDLLGSSAFAIVGPRRSGRSTVLTGAVETAIETGGTAVLVAPRPSPLRSLAGQAGIALLDSDITRDSVEAALAGRSGRVLLAIDDADEIRASPIGDLLASMARGTFDDVFLMVATTADDLGSGFSGWQTQVRKAGQGLLLSPRALTDGELIGARLSRAHVGGPIRPGQGLLHLSGGVVTQVATLAPTAHGCRDSPGAGLS